MERSANDITNMQCALILAKNDQQTAYNLRFRGGPCNVCGGPCLCLGSQLLAARLVTGLKPVGSFPFNSEADAKDCSEVLKAKGLATWIGYSRWGMWIVLASKNPDHIIPGCGSPREMAFTRDFIDERLTFVQMGALYGYPGHMSETLDKIFSST